MAMPSLVTIPKCGAYAFGGDGITSVTLGTQGVSGCTLNTFIPSNIETASGIIRGGWRLPDGVTPTPAVIATAGRGAMQEVASKKVGDVSISYDTSSSVAGSVSTGLNDLTQTVYDSVEQHLFVKAKSLFLLQLVVVHTILLVIQ